MGGALGRAGMSWAPGAPVEDDEDEDLGGGGGGGGGGDDWAVEESESEYVDLTPPNKRRRW